MDASRQPASLKVAVLKCMNVNESCVKVDRVDYMLSQAFDLASGPLAKHAPGSMDPNSLPMWGQTEHTSRGTLGMAAMLSHFTTCDFSRLTVPCVMQLAALCSAHPRAARGSSSIHRSVLEC